MRNYLTVESLYHRYSAGSYLRYKHYVYSTFKWGGNGIPRLTSDVETTVSKSFQCGLHLMCLYCSWAFQLNIVFHFNNLQPKRLETMWKIGLKWLFNKLFFKISLRDFFGNSIIHLVPVFSFISKCTKNEDFY